MAITKIHAINATVGKAVAYICNPHKTDDSVLIKTFACGKETAEYDFKFVLDKTRSSDRNKAYHLIQSFAPGETTGEEAHRIGQELADQFLQGKFSYVLATHVDRHHIHSHLIFCAADNIEHRKYKSTFGNYYKIRDISDRICAEHGLSVIRDFKEGGKTYNEWFHNRNGNSWKAQIKKDIDDTINSSISYEDFLWLMRDKGYEINGSEFGEGAAKYISFRPVGKDRFVRGRANSLGADYTKERIRERIDQRNAISTGALVHNTNKAPFSIQDFLRKYASEKPNTLIDRSRATNKGEAYSRWIDKENFKRITEIYAELGNLGLQSKEALHSKISELHSQTTYEKSIIKKMEKELRDFNQILTFARQYAETKKYNISYENSGDQDRYFRNHAYELNLYWSACEHLEQLGVDVNTLKIKDIEDHISKLAEDRQKFVISYKNKEKEYKNLKQMNESITKYLSDTPADLQNKDRKPEQLL